jgi:cytochrome b
MKMMKKLNKVYVKSSIKLQGMIKNERGSQTLEWIGIAAVVVIVVGLISTAFANDDTLGKAVLKKIKGMINQIGGGEG